MITLKALYKSARLRSLPLSVSGILVGSSLAGEYFRWEVFVLSLLTAMSYQIVSDYANDYGDAKKGTDNEFRLGPKRAIQTGEMSVQEMKKVVIFSSFISLVLTFFLIWTAFGGKNFWNILFFLILGISAIISAIKYTAGRSAYGYSGWGDVFVFVFFGVVSVLGSYFLHTSFIQWKIFLPASAIGLLSVAVLNLNNMRDIENDNRMNKKTIPVRIGKDFAMYYHHFLIFLAMILLMIFSVFTLQFGKKTLYVLAFFPLIAHLFYIRKNNSPKSLDGQLKIVALSTFLLSILFFVGYFSA